MPRNGHRKADRLAGVPDFDLLLAAATACPHGLAIERRGGIVFANAAYAALVGQSSSADVIGKSAARMRRALRSSKSKRDSHGPELDSIQLDFSHRGQKLRMEILRDVTERRRLEQHVRVAHKMEALGRAVGGVAHDFNNLLTAVTLYCDLLCREIPADGPARRHAEEISLAAKRGAAMVRQMLAFARQQVLEPQVLSLNTIVLGMKNMLQRLVGEDIELVTRCTEPLGKTKVDPAQMQEVIFNLVANARDAMPAGGKLELVTANLKVDPAQAGQHPGLRPGRCVRLTVADTGCGMTPQVLAHIFEPFFTTKERDKGTGLGLSMVYGIVTQSGGAIEVESEAGKGTRVEILLPCADKTTERKAGPSLARVHRSIAPGFETVLVVEDDEGVREPAAQILQQAGYTVLKARDGHEAAEVANRHSGPIHLLLADLIMPGMGGRELARSVRARRAHTRVLYMSGYGEQVRSVATAEPGVPVLQKPFSQSTLTHKVRQVLDEPRAMSAGKLT